LQANRIILEAAEAVVAQRTEQRSHSAGLMVMIYCQVVRFFRARVERHLRVTTNSAGSALSRKHGLVIKVRNAVFAQNCAQFGSFLSDFFLPLAKQSFAAREAAARTILATVLFVRCPRECFPGQKDFASPAHFASPMWLSMIRRIRCLCAWLSVITTFGVVAEEVRRIALHCDASISWCQGSAVSAARARFAG